LDSRAILPLYDAGAGDGPLIGAKATSLGLLHKAGLPVPPGFCVSTVAYREHMRESGLRDQARSLLGRLADSSPDGRRAGLRELRERIASVPLREDLRAKIRAGFEALGADAVAVRSSATAEDLPDASFAGQYDTFLEVRDLAGCLKAVKDCWASLWTERAFEYREVNGIDHLAVDMAVIVQELVAAETAGVLFTADPLTGASDRVIVEAVEGLGEALVSGRATPDRLVLSKKGFERIPCERANITNAGPSGPGGENVSCIGKRIARLLTLWGIWAEAVLGAPQDMEWASRNGKVFFLQSRPITTLPAERSWEDRQVWSNFNTGEVLPDVVTPMTWSLVSILVLHIFGAIFGKLGLEFKDNPIMGQVAGRAYFNLNTMMGAMRRFPAARKMNVNEVLGGEQGKLEEVGDIDIPDEDIPNLDFGIGRFLLRMPSFIAWIFANSLDKGESMIVELRSQAGELMEVDLAALDDGEMLELFRRLVYGLRDKEAIIMVAAKAMYFFMTLGKVCRRWLGDDKGSLVNRLCSGLEGMDSAEAGFELWRLAGEAGSHPGVKAAILAGDELGATWKAISHVEGGNAFISRWERFMGEYGHHAQGELEVSKPRWREDQDTILHILRGYMASLGEVDPLEKHRRNMTTRVELARDCRAELRNPLKRLAFDYYLDRAQRGSVIRENIKSEAVRHLAIIRCILLELGGRLVKGGVLTAVDDIFYLDQNELALVLEGTYTEDVGKVVASRRAEYERNLAILPPKVIRGRFDPMLFTEEREVEYEDVLHGLAVSSGVATGPARVILRPGSERVEPGEILVAPFTDPGWTPLFLTAAGIIMDMGGLLSHGSIVAREYGIPAVVNVGPATRMIKTGQIVQVDGDRGVVRVLE
jgi:phosphohistidine swiveling domain-containing protein